MNPFIIYLILGLLTTGLCIYIEGVKVNEVGIVLVCPFIWPVLLCIMISDITLIDDWWERIKDNQLIRSRKSRNEDKDV